MTVKNDKDQAMPHSAVLGTQPTMEGSSMTVPTTRSDHGSELVLARVDERLSQVMLHMTSTVTKSDLENLARQIQELKSDSVRKPEFEHVARTLDKVDTNSQKAYTKLEKQIDSMVSRREFAHVRAIAYGCVTVAVAAALFFLTEGRGPSDNVARAQAPSGYARDSEPEGGQAYAWQPVVTPQLPAPPSDEIRPPVAAGRR